MVGVILNKDREKHIYKSDAFEEIIKDTIRFFNGTPVHRFRRLSDFRELVFMQFITSEKAAITILFTSKTDLNFINRFMLEKLCQEVGGKHKI